MTVTTSATMSEQTQGSEESAEQSKLTECRLAHPFRPQAA